MDQVNGAGAGSGPASAGDAEMFDYRRIVVGTDGSDLAGPTVARAAWLAAHDDADLIIVCAFSAMSRRIEARNVAGLGDSRVGMVLGRAAANAAMSSALEVAHARGATVTSALLLEGEASAALLKVAADEDADLIVIGATREVSLAERLLGTVASEVVKRADCEVLLVRPRARDTGAAAAAAVTSAEPEVA